MTNVVYEKPSVSESYLEKIDFSEDLPVRVNRYTRDMTTVIQSHYHEELEFNLIYEKDSKIDFYVNGEKNEIHTGEVGLINSFDIHSSIPSLPTRGKEITGIKIFVNWGFLRSIFGENLSYERLRLFIPDKEANDKIRSCINRISDYYFDTEISNRRFLIMAAVCEILAYIKYEDKGNGSQNQADDGERFITYLHEMYQNPLTQSEVASLFQGVLLQDLQEMYRCIF